MGEEGVEGGAVGGVFEDGVEGLVLLGLVLVGGGGAQGVALGVLPANEGGSGDGGGGEGDGGADGVDAGAGDVAEVGLGGGDGDGGVGFGGGGEDGA